jgi:hypothetical protein
MEFKTELVVKGKITKIKDVIERKTSSGDSWAKQEFLLDTGEKYNSLFLFELLGNKSVENFNQFNSIGNNVEVSFNVQTSEYLDKHYVKLQAWKVSKVN